MAESPARTRIIEAASRLFSKQGYRSRTMRGIVEGAPPGARFTIAGRAARNSSASPGIEFGDRCVRCAISHCTGRGPRRARPSRCTWTRWAGARGQRMGERLPRDHGRSRSGLRRYGGHLFGSETLSARNETSSADRFTSALRMMPSLETIVVGCAGPAMTWLRDHRRSTRGGRPSIVRGRWHARSVR